MDCKKIILLNRYIDNDLNENEERELSEHLKNCEQCAARYKLLKSISGALPQAFNVEPPNYLYGKVMTSIKREQLSTKVFKITKYISDWRVYTSVAACVLMLFIVKGGVDKKYRDYLDNTDPSQAIVNNLDQFKTPDVKPAEEEYREIEGILPEETVIESVEAQATAPPNDQAAVVVPTPTPSSSLKSQINPSPSALPQINPLPSPAAATSQPKKMETPQPNAGTPKPAATQEPPPAEHAPQHDSLQENSTMSTGSGGGSADTRISGVQGASATTFTVTSPAKEKALSYNPPPASQFQRLKVTFVITFDEQRDKAYEILSSHSKGGRAAVKSAFAAAGIQYREQESVAEDYISRHTELVSKVNSIKSRLLDTNDESKISSLTAELEGIKSSIKSIVALCADTILQIG